MKTRKNVKSRRNRRKSAKSRCRKHRYTLRGGLKISDKPGLAFNIPGFGKYKSEARREHDDKKQKEEEEEKEKEKQRRKEVWAAYEIRRANEANEREAKERAWELANPEEAALKKLEKRREAAYRCLRDDDAWYPGLNIDDYLDYC